MEELQISGFYVGFTAGYFFGLLSGGAFLLILFFLLHSVLSFIEYRAEKKELQDQADTPTKPQRPAKDEQNLIQNLEWAVKGSYPNNFISFCRDAWLEPDSVVASERIFGGLYGAYYSLPIDIAERIEAFIVTKEGETCQVSITLDDRSISIPIDANLLTTTIRLSEPDCSGAIAQEIIIGLRDGLGNWDTSYMTVQ